jgi:hypothetical protein
MTLISVFLQGTNTTSPDGKFKLTVETKEESDLQTRYITKLTDNTSKQTIEIANCIRRDLSAPSYYWDKNSKYLVFEQCDESFKDSRIKILDLRTRKVEFELIGLIGNQDVKGQQFDFRNGVLIYYDTSTDSKRKIPSLWSLNIGTKERKRLLEFDADFEMEFPEIKRADDKRQLTITYSDVVSGQRTVKQVAY